MNILLLGRDGQVGWELSRALPPLAELTSLGREDLDLAHPDRIPDVLDKLRPDVIINAAAYTAVDRAEQEPEVAHRVNALGPARLAEAAKERGSAFIHLSTDYVFDGALHRPYTEDDATNPRSTYGRSKLEGERLVQQVGGACLILRTSWVYSLRRPCFVTQVLAWARTRDQLRIAEDQVGTPTWCRLVAEAIALMMARLGPHPVGALAARSGLYHLASWGPASRLEWARRILMLDPRPEEQLVHAEGILPAPSRDFVNPADRPAYSALDSTRFASTFGLKLPGWEEGLRLAMAAA